MCSVLIWCFWAFCYIETVCIIMSSCIHMFVRMCVRAYVHACMCVYVRECEVCVCMCKAGLIVRLSLCVLATVLLT